MEVWNLLRKSLNGDQYKTGEVMKLICASDIGFSPKRGDYWKKNGVMYLMKKVTYSTFICYSTEEYDIEVEIVKDTNQKCWK